MWLTGLTGDDGLELQATTLIQGNTVPTEKCRRSLMLISQQWGVKTISSRSEVKGK